ncbi:hypothetical protein [Cryobacterium sp. TMT2-4]|uniref:hypothetical protein n=1 Tax=Cryobacterium sp. TMT2-4 TaxID=1259254 RepID=UPI00141BBC0C|nr:hypothetical protein [Cryobacterium sp. TMT2-4]
MPTPSKRVRTQFSRTDADFKTMASEGQIRAIRGLMASLHLSIAPDVEKKLRYQTTSDQADTWIKKLRNPDQEHTPQIGYLLGLREKARRAASAEEVEALRGLSTKELSSLTQQAMRDVQEWNDTHGVPIPKWRMVRGLFSQELLERNGSYNTPRLKPGPRKLTLDELRRSVGAQTGAI